jgi:hypothetical protein
MAVQPRDPKKAQPEPEKKKAETVLLSAEELKRLAGGGRPVNPSPPPSLHTTNATVKKP